MRRILVTGCAGFIGSNLVDELLERDYIVVGIDNFNNYYDPTLKERNLKHALLAKNFSLKRVDICNFSALEEVFTKLQPDVVVHLAARAGVRPSILNPALYSQVNVLGTLNLLKVSTQENIQKFIYGSSSSVYGNSKILPFSENDLCEAIISPYGASKRSAEFLVESWFHNFQLKSIILRFFTVYGERGRPDMAPAIFTKAILTGDTIKQYGDGKTSRDYTYIGDIVSGILAAISTNLNLEIINLGNSTPVSLSKLILTIEKITGKFAKIEVMPMQIGDVNSTCAKIDKAKQLLNWKPKTKLPEGLTNYVKWLENPQ